MFIRQSLFNVTCLSNECGGWWIKKKVGVNTLCGVYHITQNMTVLERLENNLGKCFSGWYCNRNCCSTCWVCLKCGFITAMIITNNYSHDGNSLQLWNKSWLFILLPSSALVLVAFPLWSVKHVLNCFLLPVSWLMAGGWCSCYRSQTQNDPSSSFWILSSQLGAWALECSLLSNSWNGCNCVCTDLGDAVAVRCERVCEVTCALEAKVCDSAPP